MTDTDVERLARIGEPLRLRGLVIASHEEQPERIDGRLLALYPPDFRTLVATAEAQGQERLDFLSWYAQQGAQAQRPHPRPSRLYHSQHSQVETKGEQDNV